MAITISNSLAIQTAKMIDNRFGPWASVLAALNITTGIPMNQRALGLTVGIGATVSPTGAIT
jgi:hypothetical protein